MTKQPLKANDSNNEESISLQEMSAPEFTPSIVIEHVIQNSSLHEIGLSNDHELLRRIQRFVFTGKDDNLKKILKDLMHDAQDLIQVLLGFHVIVKDGKIKHTEEFDRFIELQKQRIWNNALSNNSHYPYTKRQTTDSNNESSNNQLELDIKE